MIAATIHKTRFRNDRLIRTADTVLRFVSVADVVLMIISQSAAEEKTGACRGLARAGSRPTQACQNGLDLSVSSSNRLGMSLIWS